MQVAAVNNIYRDNPAGDEVQPLATTFAFPNLAISDFVPDYYAAVILASVPDVSNVTTGDPRPDGAGGIFIDTTIYAPIRYHALVPDMLNSGFRDIGNTITTALERGSDLEQAAMAGLLGAAGGVSPAAAPMAAAPTAAAPTAAGSRPKGFFSKAIPNFVKKAVVEVVKVGTKVIDATKKGVGVLASPIIYDVNKQIARGLQVAARGALPDCT